MTESPTLIEICVRAHYFVNIEKHNLMINKSNVYVHKNVSMVYYVV